MKQISISFTFILFTFALASNTQSDFSNSLDEAKKAIAKSNEIYFQAFVKNDSSIFINRYAKDACIMAPNSPAFCGADAPLHFFKLAYNTFGLRNGKFITTQVYGVDENYVVEEGLWQSLMRVTLYLTTASFLCCGRRPRRAGRCSGIRSAATGRTRSEVPPMRLSPLPTFQIAWFSVHSEHLSKYFNKSITIQERLFQNIHYDSGTVIPI